MKNAVLVSIVTYHSEQYLENCLQSVEGQNWPTRVKMLDNSSDSSCAEIATRHGAEIELAPGNLGFSVGHNRNLAGEEFEWALLLNADVVLEEDFLEQLLEAVRLRESARVGTAGGKLLRMHGDGSPIITDQGPVLDSTGIYFTPTLRHFDRGGGEPDRGQFEEPEWVFGITGAALLFSQAFYRDLRDGDEFLDADFFVYREDADLAWRGQLRDWNSLYVPTARAGHARHVTPRVRRRLSAAINCHSVKNRFLMRRKNIDWAVRFRCGPFMWIRDFAILGYVLLFERSSLQAFRTLWSIRSRTTAKRHRIQQTRTRPPTQLAWWFAFRPRSRPARSMGN